MNILIKKNLKIKINNKLKIKIKNYSSNNLNKEGKVKMILKYKNNKNKKIILNKVFFNLKYLFKRILKNY